MDAQRREINDAAILVEGRIIISVGTTEEVEKWMQEKNRQAEQIICDSFFEPGFFQPGFLHPGFLSIPITDLSSLVENTLGFSQK